jgi:hypothetical protein
MGSVTPFPWIALLIWLDKLKVAFPSAERRFTHSSTNSLPKPDNSWLQGYVKTITVAAGRTFLITKQVRLLSVTENQNED